MSHDEVYTKARDLIEPVIGAAKTDHLLRQIDGLEHLRNVREMSDNLRA